MYPPKITCPVKKIENSAFIVESKGLIGEYNKERSMQCEGNVLLKVNNRNIKTSSDMIHG